MSAVFVFVFVWVPPQPKEAKPAKRESAQNNTIDVDTDLFI